MQALESGQRIKQRELHFQELGIATLSSIFVNANKDPKKGKTSKPADFFYFSTKEGLASIKLNKHACNAFFSLVRDNKIPKWVMGVVPLSQLRNSHDNGFVPSNRALISGNCLILAYTVFNNDKIYSPLSFIGAYSQATIVTDVDSGKSYSIETVDFKANSTIIDGEYKLNG